MYELSERVAVLEGRVNELSQTNQRFNILEQQIFVLGEKIDRVEENLRSEIVAVREELKAEISGVEERFDSKLSSLRKELKLDISALEEEITSVRDEIRGFQDKVEGEMAVFRHELFNGLNNVRDELGRRIDKYFGWLVVIIIALCVNLAGVSYQILMQLWK